MNSTDLENNLIMGGLARHAHYILVAGIVSVLMLMMLPLPTPILDFLLAVNIVGVLALLLVALSLTHPLKLSTFPTLLLMTTLFRLGLNIASTRLILTTGEAGQIIHTFGFFVTQGNLLVGCLSTLRLD